MVMAYWIPTSSDDSRNGSMIMEWKSVRKEVSGEIMKTDVLCEILCDKTDEALANVCLEQAFGMFRDFEARYSRFLRNNDLWRFNVGETTVLSEELFDIVRLAKKYHEATRGIFDPSILSAMETEGYRGVYAEHVVEKAGDFSELVLNESARTVLKPKGLMIDLGGIGKGYVVDKVARFLGERFEHFLVDAGGDLFASGTNRKEGYDYWAIDVEDPTHSGKSVALLLLKDMAVATSGRNRRHWIKDGREKHHIVDPITQESASSDFLSVTVVAANTVEADVLAKTFFIAGKEKGIRMAETSGVPALFIDKQGNIIHNQFIEPYVWKP